MTVGFRVATELPWDEDRKVDWGDPIPSEAKTIDVVLNRARNHKGQGYKTRERGAPKWSAEYQYKNLDEHLDWRLSQDNFRMGDMVVVWCLADNTTFLIRKVDMPAVSMKTVGDADVDFNHGLVFGPGGINGAESWGIRNDRYISGTTIPSAHWARKSGNRPCEARAEDFFHPSRMWDLARLLAKGGHCGKILFAGSEWMPGWDGFRHIGSFIDHYDHVHAESRFVSGSLC